jgi:hypothetical protein
LTSKIIRGDGVTELANIKSVTYTETVNAGDGLRPGCVASSSINVECYGAQSDAPSQDEALTYYQVVNGVETLVGIFYAEPSIPSKGTYKFVAYDSVAKLDVDFSARLNAIQDDFPMSIYDLVSEACSVAGVMLGSSSWPLSTQTVQAFYSDNLTCRNILQYAAEMACRFARCNTSGEVVFDWYATNSTGIYPGGNDNTKVAYKQNGLTYDNSNVYVVDSVAIKPSGVEGAAYIYPTSYSAVTASDPNGDGNIILTNLIASDLGNGELLLSVEAEDDNTDGNVDVGTQTVTVNPMIFSNNLLLTNASDVTYLAVAQNIYNVMSALPSYRHSTTQLFVDENPFHAGEFVSVTDAQGVSFTTPVFTMTVSASGANLVSSGKVKYQEQSSTSLAKSVANLASNIVQFNTKVVFKNNLTDGETVISGDNIQTGEINADLIKTGTLTVTDSNDNILFQADVSQNAVKLGLWEVTENSLYIQNSVRDALIRTSVLQANNNVIWQQLNGKAVVSEGENVMFVNNITFNGVVPYFTELQGVADGLSIPRTIWSNSSPGTSMSSQTLSISDPVSWDAPLKAPSHFNMFYIEVCWDTTYTSHRSGTWVYVPSGTTVRAHPSVDWYDGSYDAHVYRIVTIENGTISIGTGNKATGTGVTEGSSYAIPTRIIAMRIMDSLF